MILLSQELVTVHHMILHQCTVEELPILQKEEDLVKYQQGILKQKINMINQDQKVVDQQKNTLFTAHKKDHWEDVIH